MVEKENVHALLVEKLTLLGLNEKEQADFIEFWEPEMQSAPYYFITFLGNREMDALAPLTIDEAGYDYSRANGLFAVGSADQNSRI